MKKSRRTTEQIIRILRDAEGRALFSGVACGMKNTGPHP